MYVAFLHLAMHVFVLLLVVKAKKDACRTRTSLLQFKFKTCVCTVCERERSANIFGNFCISGYVRYHLSERMYVESVMCMSYHNNGNLAIIFLHISK